MRDAEPEFVFETATLTFCPSVFEPIPVRVAVEYSSRSEHAHMAMIWSANEDPTVSLVAPHDVLIERGMLCGDGWSGSFEIGAQLMRDNVLTLILPQRGVKQTWPRAMYAEVQVARTSNVDYDVNRDD